jgi:HlyD family secretion protein
MSRRVVIWVATVAVLGALAAAGISTASSLTTAADTTPTARAVSGSLSLDVSAAGDLRATRMMPVTAPPVGGQLRILSMVTTGERVEPGDVILEFDPVDQQYALEQALSQLAEAEQEIVRLKANAAVQAAQTRVDLMTARFDVRRAELDIRGDEDLVAANERKKRELTLEESRRRLAQLEEDEQSRAQTSAAQMAVLQERLNRQRAEADRARQNMAGLAVTARTPGLVVVRENRDASGGIFFSGMTLPEFKAGDMTGAGRPILDVFDISGIEVRMRIPEHERDNVAVDQDAVVTFDAIPGLQINAKVASVSSQAMRSMEALSPIRQFDAGLRLERIDERLRPGTSVHVHLKGRTVSDVVYVPRTAIFEREGKPVVYVREPGAARFTTTPVKVTYRTEAHAAVEGLAAGAEVSLVNPEKKAGASAPAAGTGAAPAGGGPPAAAPRAGGPAR